MAVKKMGKKAKKSRKIAVCYPKARKRGAPSPFENMGKNPQILP
jgi:hypothetical protein